VTAGAIAVNALKSGEGKSALERDKAFLTIYCLPFAYGRRYDQGGVMPSCRCVFAGVRIDFSDQE
jgi:hypothetical protein